MRILNFGSLNIDHVYQVDHFVRAGETLASSGYARHMGGKGFNQSIALARAGAAVCHAGCMGEDGDFMRAYLREAGVDTSFLRTVDGPTGHAMIQVEPSGENCILLFAKRLRTLRRAIFCFCKMKFLVCRHCWKKAQSAVCVSPSIPRRWTPES